MRSAPINRTPFHCTFVGFARERGLIFPFKFVGKGLGSCRKGGDGGSLRRRRFTGNKDKTVGRGANVVAIIL